MYSSDCVEMRKGKWQAAQMLAEKQIRNSSKFVRGRMKVWRMVALQLASRILRLEEWLSVPWRGSVILGEEASRIVVDSETVKA